MTARAGGDTPPGAEGQAGGYATCAEAAATLAEAAATLYELLKHLPPA